MASLSTFKTQSPPSDQGIKLLFDYYGKVIAINIKDTGCDDKNYALSLATLQYITINKVTIEIIETFPQDGHYSYTTVPTYLPLDFQTGVCSSVVLVPLKDGIDFTYSNYNATLGNSVELRRYNGVYEVDYRNAVTGSAKPSNLQAILSGSATLAEVQESNYTTVGIANSHYNGAKTSINDYGINSAISATPFKAATYLSSVADAYICSQSLSDKTINEYIFTGNDKFPTSGSRIFELDGSRLLPVRDRKVWVESNNRVLATDIDGYTITSGSLCSI